MSTRAWQVIAGILIFLLFGIPIYIIMVQHWQVISDVFLVLFFCGVAYLIGLMALSLRGRFINQDLIYTKDGRMPAHRRKDGSVEVLVDDHPVAEHLTLSSNQRGLLPPPQQVVEEVKQLPKNELPKAKPFDEVRYEIGPDRFILGYYLDEQGINQPLWVSLDLILTMIAIGPQGVGKSTLVRSLGLQQAMFGGDMAICDWYGDIAGEMRPFFEHSYTLSDEIEAFAGDVLLPEIEQRRQRYLDGERQFKPFFLVIDEWLELAPDCPSLAQVIKKSLSIGRKIGWRLSVSSVGLYKRHLGGGEYGNNTATVFLFTPNENIAEQWGLSGKDIKTLLSRLYTTGSGYCLVSSARLRRRAELISLMNVTPDIFKRVLLENRGQIPIMQPIYPPPKITPLRPRSDIVDIPSPPSSPPVDLVEVDLAEEDQQEGREGRIRLPRREYEQILALWDGGKGTAPWRIARAMNKASEYYYTVRAVIQHERQRLQAAESEEQA